MSDERSFERFVADNVAGNTGFPLPDDFYDDMHSFATTTRQRPEWLALIKEPPMRTNNHLAVGSPTVRVAAIMIATMLLAVALAAAGIAGQRLLAADSAIIVDQSGAGDYSTLAEAVAAAADGDEILVRPGAYTEAVVIDKDITVAGDGPREEIVISGHQDPELWAPGSECETSEPGACAVVLYQTAATFSGITFSGDHSGLKIVGGAPTVTGVVFDHVGVPRSSGPADGGGLALLIDAGSAAQILGNEFVATADLVIDDGAVPLIEGNVLREGSQITANDAGDETVIRANEITGAAAVGISLNSATKLLIEDNVVTASVHDGIQLSPFGSDGVEPVIRGNTITASGGSAVNGISGGAPTIEGNTLVDNEFGLLLGLGQAVIRGNDILGQGSGITVTRGSDPTISENTIDVAGTGVTLADGARGNLSDNDVCGGATSISVHENAVSVIDDTNVTCDGTAP